MFSYHFAQTMKPQLSREKDHFEADPAQLRDGRTDFTPAFYVPVTSLTSCLIYSILIPESEPQCMVFPNGAVMTVIWNTFIIMN